MDGRTGSNECDQRVERRTSLEPALRSRCVGLLFNARIKQRPKPTSAQVEACSNLAGAALLLAHGGGDG